VKKAAGRAAAPRASSMKRAATPRAWQRMLSGRRLDLLDPSPLDIEIEDIAHGLARVARWNGQTTGPHIFSVAQHSLLVELVSRKLAPNLDRRWRLAVLLHDAPEYVIGDLISPFKAILKADYKAVVGHVKKADRHAAFLEATQLAGFKEAEARRFFGTPPGLDAAAQKRYLTPWNAETAEKRFLARFEELSDKQ
jgi:5'-deoxynucleotidase YfbR-like HD superfamily hydrolase